MCFSCSERLNLRLLNIDSLEMRRLRADLILCFKILKGFVDVDASEFFERITHDSVTRSHGYKSVHPSVRINVRQYFLQFELFQFGILFRQMFLRLSPFFVLRRVFLMRVLQNVYVFYCIFI